jgi:predicted transcriptional regulator
MQMKTKPITNEIILIVTTGTEVEFFQSGRKLSLLADQKKTMSAKSVVTFEDPADMRKLLTAGRLALIRAIKDQPGSITAISSRLRRDRSAVGRDIDRLAKIGLLKVESRVLPGHGRIKEIWVAAQQIKLVVFLS